MSTTPESLELPPLNAASPADRTGHADTNRYALVVVDAQIGFDDPSWGQRNNPDCDDNIERLVTAWHEREAPLVYVRHDSEELDSPLHPDNPGNRLKPYLHAEPDLVVTKQVNSAFHGYPDLHAWLTAADIAGIVVCGITTNHCCETTARVGGNLGYRVLFALDATHTFDREGPDGTALTADQLAQATATNLHGEFATVVTVKQLLAAPPGTSST
ncbi:MAG: isochorismatase family protein [Marmoricola sp.]